jgi:hypothetical protein
MIKQKNIWTTMFGSYKPSFSNKTNVKDKNTKIDINDYTPVVIINSKAFESFKIIENYFKDINVPKIKNNHFPIVIINIKEFESFKIIDDYFNDTYSQDISKINISTDSLNNNYMFYEE